MKSTKSIKSILTLFVLTIVSVVAADAQALVNQQYRKALDFDGDGKADMTVLRRNGVPNLTWYTRQSSNGATRGTQFGLVNGVGNSGSTFDTPQPGDYDGDGKADLVVVRRNQGFHTSWFILRSGSNTMTAERFGTSTDVVAGADYDGDGKTDMAVVRRLAGNSGDIVYIQQSSNNQMVSRTQNLDASPNGCSREYGMDIDGDGKHDLTQICYGGTSMTWVVQRTSDGATERHHWGQFINGVNNDTPVPADYDGDGKSDLAVVRAVYSGSGNVYYYQWYIRRSSDGAMQTMQFGRTDYTYQQDGLVPADYDGDGKADIAVFRQQTYPTIEPAYFYVARSGSGGSVQAVQWGTGGDIALNIGLGYMPTE